MRKTSTLLSSSPWGSSCKRFDRKGIQTYSQKRTKKKKTTHLYLKTVLINVFYIIQYPLFFHFSFSCDCNSWNKNFIYTDRGNTPVNWKSSKDKGWKQLDMLKSLSSGLLDWRWILLILLSSFMSKQPFVPHDSLVHQGISLELIAKGLLPCLLRIKHLKWKKKHT